MICKITGCWDTFTLLWGTGFVCRLMIWDKCWVNVHRILHFTDTLIHLSKIAEKMGMYCKYHMSQWSTIIKIHTWIWQTHQPWLQCNICDNLIEEKWNGSQVNMIDNYKVKKIWKLPLYRSVTRYQMQLCVVVIISFIILHMILIDNSSTQQVLSYSIQNIY